MMANDSARRRRTRPQSKGRLRQKKPAPKQANGSTESQARSGVLDDYISTEKLAAELDVAPLTVIRWRLQKQGPPVTRLGRRILYRRASVQAWLAAQEQRWA
jgi:hypothetical protein